MLTISRIVLSPIFFILLLKGEVYAGLIIFFIAALTDALDGWVARHKKQITVLGQILDPIADKLMVILAIIALLIKFNFPVIGLLMLSRDFVSVFGSFLTYFKKKKAWKANIPGKLTTFFQIVTVIGYTININFKFIILLFTIALSFLAAIIYFITIIKIIKEK